MKSHRLLLLLLLAVSVQGCSYFQQRLSDARNVIDLGLTFSSKPQFALYYSGPIVQIGTIGYGDVDGRFFGLGEGHGHLWSPHYEKSYGLVAWGQEWVSFDHDKAALDALPAEEAEKVSNHMQVGVVGFVRGGSGDGAPPPGPKYIVSCPHFIHLGWVGVVANPRWLQMVNFVVGWTGLELLKNDNAGSAAKTTTPAEEKK